MARWLCALVVAAALGGCKFDIDRHVLLIGDSLMLSAMPIISSTLFDDDDHGWVQMYSVHAGVAFANAQYGAEYWPYQAPQILASHAVDTVVIGLGINDAQHQLVPSTTLSPQQLTAAAARLMDAYAGRRVLWIMPHQVPGNAPLNVAINTVNAAISAAAYGRPNVTLVSFDDYVAGRGRSMESVTVADRIHLNPDGYQLWADMIKGAAR